MAAEYRPASEYVVNLVKEIIDLYHDDLAEARIGLLWRDEAPWKGEMRVMGKAKKVSPEYQAFLPYDFIIWFARDVWGLLTDHQRRALVDHELQHCYLEDDSVPKLREHDFEEFTVIIERYGFWWPRADTVEQAVQSRFGFVKVEDSGPRPVSQDVLDQVSGLFDGEATDG